MAEKGMAVFTHNGEDYTINDPNIAGEFSASKIYAKRNFAYYKGKLYKFTADHPAGAWNAAHVQEAFVSAEMGKVNGGNEETAKITGKFLLDSGNFDIGSAGNAGGQFVYPDDNTRVRTKPGYTIHLGEGFNIELTDYTTARYFFVRRNPDGTFTNSGWRTGIYRTVNEGDYAIVIEGIPAGAQTSVDTLFSMLKITYKNTGIDQLEEKIEDATGNVILDKGDFELGNMSISNTGWVYADSEKRVRMREGITLHMYEGDSFGLTDYTKYRYFYGYRTMGGTYVAGAGWMTSGIVADEECDLVFIVEKNDEQNIWDIDEIFELIRFQRGRSMAKVSYDFKALGLRGINHQGYNRVAPQNTLPAFALSKVMGFDFVETDVRFTSDNVPVLCHNATIDATSDGSGTISEMTYQALLQYDFGSWKSAEYAGTKIPTLEQLFALCNNISLYPYAEVMEGLTAAQAKICIDAAKKYNMLRSVTWISFSFDALRLITEEDPGARVLLIITVGDSVNFVRKAKALETGYNEVGVDINYTMGQAWKDAALRFDMPIEMWTVDTISDLEALPEYVKGVTSNTYPISRIREADQLSMAKPYAYNSVIANISGGYSIVRDRVLISMTYTGNSTAGSTAQIASGLPVPKRIQAVTVLAMNGGSISEMIPGYIDTDGNLYAGKVASGTSYVMNGEYSLI